MSEEKLYCERCGKELIYRCGYSRIDHKLICVECDDKEQPKELMKRITDLELKLAESEKTEDGAFWFEKWQHKKRDYDSVYKAYIENCAEVDQLKQQLAEEKNRNKKLNHEAQKYYEDAYCNGFQNEKAVAELEKVKEWLELKYFDKEQINYLTNAIDQQIKELKGDK